MCLFEHLKIGEIRLNNLIAFRNDLIEKPTNKILQKLEQS